MKLNTTKNQEHAEIWNERAMLIARRQKLLDQVAVIGANISELDSELEQHFGGKYNPPFAYGQARTTRSA